MHTKALALDIRLNIHVDDEKFSEASQVIHRRDRQCYYQPSDVVLRPALPVCVECKAGHSSDHVTAGQ